MVSDGGKRSTWAALGLLSRRGNGPRPNQEVQSYKPTTRTTSHALRCTFLLGHPNDNRSVLARRNILGYTCIALGFDINVLLGRSDMLRRAPVI